MRHGSTFPVQSGLVLSTASGTNSTSPLINTYGNGVIAVLQDGSVAKPFQQTALSANSITDPNGAVSTGNQALDLRWGAKAAPYTLPMADNVQVRTTATARAIQARRAKRVPVSGRPATCEL